ncbi:hypothetical protein [Bacteroides graminisolvens]|uniref:Uncharacterized protein n=1 Tax=Bacteroides graminisolvens DSM 19988 = JCM 15093 TaxID=1121097 RepID=A0A069D4Q5_9BACE|nr:hypothetical protein [Bacteroides graminisolvens]GAK37281.1 hypothetical protein JCM15093_2523 [Bacteroides graminisolvens DSM 19988 = JCM 15093]
MRKLFFILSVILLASCSSDSENPAMLSNSDISIEKIVLNNQTYTVGAKSFMISGAPLTVTGTLSSSKRVEVEYLWNKTAEILSSVVVECKNPTATVNVKKESASELFNKFTVTVITTTPEAQVVYTIAALKTAAPEQK